MKFEGKAFYNLIKINALEDPSFTAKPWQKEDLETIETIDLLNRINSLGYSFDEESLKNIIEESDSPEDLAIILYHDDDIDVEEKVYLLIFELWRRLCPEKETLSIFCDRLDHLMLAYDQETLDDDEPLVDALKELENIFDGSVDSGIASADVLNSISPYMAHDVETFLCDFILDQIDSENLTYASELIDGFCPYIKDKLWFDFLRLNLLFTQDSQEASLMADRLIDDLREHPDLELLFALLRSLVHVSETETFLQAFVLACHQIHVESEFRELLDIALDYFSALDMEEEEGTLDALLKGRTAPLDAPFDPHDPDFETLNDLFLRKFSTL